MSFLIHKLWTLDLWVKIGFLGQALFTARFLVQWIASEKKRDSVVPVAFWWLSLSGGIILLMYAISKEDPVFIVGQGMGLIVYVRNLMLVGRTKRQSAKRLQRGQATAGRETPSAHKPRRTETTERTVPWA